MPKTTKTKIDKDNVKQFLLGKYHEKWLEDNPALSWDIEELVWEVQKFNMTWGSDFTLISRSALPPKEDN